MEEVQPVHLPETHVSPFGQSRATLQLLVQVPMVAPVHCSVTPQSAFVKQAAVPQLPTLLQELLPQSPAAQGLDALQVAPTQLPWVTPVQLSILPQADSWVQVAAVPLQVPELSVHFPLSHCELV